MCERRLHLSSTFNKLPSLLSILKRSSKQEAKDLLKALSKENTVPKENDSDLAKVEPMAVGSSEEMNMLFVQECSEVSVVCCCILCFIFACISSAFL